MFVASESYEKRQGFSSFLLLFTPSGRLIKDQQFPVKPTAEVCVPDFWIGRLG